MFVGRVSCRRELTIDGHTHIILFEVDRSDDTNPLYHSIYAAFSGPKDAIEHSRVT